MAAELTTFPNRAALRRWLARHHSRESELLLRCHKRHAADQGVTYAEALDEALCYGWIDGVRRGVDADSFSVRFSPRRPRSIWSRVNVGHVERLTAAGRMAPPGIAAFQARIEQRTGLYSFERPPARLTAAFERRLRSNQAAWEYYRKRPPWYRRTATFWVMSAKRPETRERRLDMLIESSARGVPIGPLARDPRITSRGGRQTPGASRPRSGRTSTSAGPAAPGAGRR